MDSIEHHFKIPNNPIPEERKTFKHLERAGIKPRSSCSSLTSLTNWSSLPWKLCHDFKVLKWTCHVSDLLTSQRQVSALAPIFVSVTRLPNTTRPGPTASGSWTTSLWWAPSRKSPVATFRTCWTCLKNHPFLDWFVNFYHFCFKRWYEPTFWAQPNVSFVSWA